MQNFKQQYIIATYDINGKHILLEYNKPKVFETIDKAKDFLMTIGYTTDEIEEFSIELVNKLDLEAEYVIDKK
jgi:hypothetical protein